MVYERGCLRSGRVILRASQPSAVATSAGVPSAASNMSPSRAASSMRCGWRAPPGVTSVEAVRATICAMAIPSAAQAKSRATMSAALNRRRIRSEAKGMAPAHTSATRRKVAKIAVTQGNLLRLLQRVRFCDEARGADGSLLEIEAGREPEALRHLFGRERCARREELSLEELSHLPVAVPVRPEAPRDGVVHHPRQHEGARVVGRVEGVVQVVEVALRLLVVQLERVGGREQLAVQLARVGGRFVRMCQQAERGSDLACGPAVEAQLVGDFGEGVAPQVKHLDERGAAQDGGQL